MPHGMASPDGLLCPNGYQGESNMAGLKPVQYIGKHLRLPGETTQDFMAQWKDLSDEDKDDLRRWAEEEQAITASAS